MCLSRKFNWISSSDPKNHDFLINLNQRMIDFYFNIASREQYQKMVDTINNDLPRTDIITNSFIRYIEQLQAKCFLEVGCGNSRVYKLMKKQLPKITYTGTEVSKEIIEQNKFQHPTATWQFANAYELPIASESIDVCFSFYVLEHLVFPEKAIIEMLRTVKKDGFLILIFPDFSASGRFASQQIGFGKEPTSISKLKKGNFFDAVVSLYDSRIRLPKSLKQARKNIGAFPVNLNPKCLYESDSISPDIDAVYITSKLEVQEWAEEKGYKVEYPVGKEGIFKEHAFLSIHK
jgi:ubiquinone/menaquinone biosynthesis C-methylase UbiE